MAERRRRGVGDASYTDLCFGYSLVLAPLYWMFSDPFTLWRLQAGGRLVVVEQLGGTSYALWVLPGPQQDALAANGQLLPAP